MSQQRLSITVIAVVSGCLAAGSGALAQDEQPGSAIDEETVELIVVTGSRIKRLDFNTPSPLTTINTEDIAFNDRGNAKPDAAGHAGIWAHKQLRWRRHCRG